MFIEIKANRKSLSNRKLISGVGINDSWYQISSITDGKTHFCPYYSVWKSMIDRCYSKKSKEKYPTYLDCYVCDEWFVFSVFKGWMSTQDWQGKFIDKDIIKYKNKIYCPEFCVFVTREINNIILDNKSIRGEHPQGVYFDKRRCTYHSKLKVDGVAINIGTFKTSVGASLKYRQSKYDHLISVAIKQSDKRVSAGLMKHALLYKD